MLSLFFSQPVAAAESGGSRSSSISIELQYLRGGQWFDDSPIYAGGGEIGVVETHALVFSGELELNEQWSLFGSLPLINRRHQGLRPHRFGIFQNYDPPDRTLVDDGDFHGGFQDLTLGVRYRATRGRLHVSPFISVSVPTNEYPFYGKAALGTNLWRVPFGVRLDFQPWFSDWHFGGGLTYAVSERPMDVNVNYWVLDASAGYYFSPGWSASIFVTQKETPNGLRLPEDFTSSPTYQNPQDLDSERWWQHDRIIAHEFTNVGVGLDVILSDRYQLGTRLFSTIHASQSPEVEFGITLGLTRQIGRE